MYKVLVFDFDGTLCSSSETVRIAMQNTFVHFGRDKPSSAAIQAMLHQGPSLERSFFILDDSLRQLPLSDLTPWLNYYRQNYKKHTSASELYPHVLQLLTTLHDHGFECLIVSNKHSSSINACLSHENIGHFFSAIYGENSGYPAKPSPMIFEKAILADHPHYTHQDFLMIGDTETDYYFAEACGIDMAWATYGFGNPESSDLQQAAYQLKSLKDLETILGLTHD